MNFLRNIMVLGLANIAFTCVSFAQTPSLPRDKVLASNQRTSVTYADFEAEISRIPPRDQYEFMMDRQRLALLVDNILLNKTLAIEARENKLENDPLVKAEIQNQTDKVLAKYRGQQIQNTAPKIDYLPRARELYLANPERFTSPPLYDVWHLLVGLNGRTKEQAKARAEELRARLIAGESPEKLAADLSDDATAKASKGNLGATNLKDFDPRFAAAISKLKAGEISPVFESDFGFHIAKLKSFQAPGKLSYDAVKPELLNEAENQYVQSVWEAHMRNIRNDPKIFVDTDALEVIRPKLPPAPQVLPLPVAKTQR